MTTRHCTHGLWSLSGIWSASLLLMHTCYYGDVFTHGCLNNYIKGLVYHGYKVTIFYYTLLSHCLYILWTLWHHYDVTTRSHDQATHPPWHQESYQFHILMVESMIIPIKPSFHMMSYLMSICTLSLCPMRCYDHTLTPNGYTYIHTHAHFNSSS